MVVTLRTMKDSPKIKGERIDAVGKDCIRRTTKEVLATLLEESALKTPDSWIQNNDNSRSASRTASCLFFDTAGFRHVSSFATAAECAAMKHKMKELVDEWNPDQGLLDCNGTDEDQFAARGDYFLESANKTHFFAEPAALDTDGSSLLPQYQQDKLTALNKVGHGLHLQPGVFNEYCRSAKVRELVTDLGWKDAVAPQGMYIFKQARTGGVVNSHQDSTFLYTTAKQSCLGLWLALDDSTVDNGCLWVRPKSHREPVRRQFKKNPAHFGADAIQARSNNAVGDTSQPKLLMEDLYEHAVDWEGKLPLGDWKGLLKIGFIPVECKAGDLVVFAGELDHLSLPNYSDRPRHTFQLHLVEGPGGGVTWSPSNWLQYPAGKSFVRLND